jgi:hypothetical protein
MGLFDALIKSTQVVAKAATLPVSIAADVFTGAGAHRDEGEPYTISHLKELQDDAEDAIDELDK